MKISQTLEANMRFIAILFSLAVLAMYSTTNWASPLVGNWRYDHDRTVNEVSKIKELPQSLRSFYELYQDNAIYKFTNDKKYSIKNGKSVEQAYEVTGSGKNSVSIKFTGGQMKDYVITYYFENDAMYVLTSKYKLKQYYKRVSE